MKVYFSREDHIEISDSEHQRFLDRFFGFDINKLVILSEYLFGARNLDNADEAIQIMPKEHLFISRLLMDIFIDIYIFDFSLEEKKRLNIETTYPNSNVIVIINKELGLYGFYDKKNNITRVVGKLMKDDLSLLPIIEVLSDLFFRFINTCKDDEDEKDLLRVFLDKYICVMIDIYRQKNKNIRKIINKLVYVYRKIAYMDIYRIMEIMFETMEGGKFDEFG